MKKVKICIDNITSLLDLAGAKLLAARDPLVCRIDVYK